MFLKEKALIINKIKINNYLLYFYVYLFFLSSVPNYISCFKMLIYSFVF